MKVFVICYKEVGLPEQVDLRLSHFHCRGTKSK